MKETKEANERETTDEHPADHHLDHQPVGLAEGSEDQTSRRRNEVGEGTKASRRTEEREGRKMNEMKWNQWKEQEVRFDSRREAQESKDARQAEKDKEDNSTARRVNRNLISLGMY
jgi:hypothetical protein